MLRHLAVRAVAAVLISCLGAVFCAPEGAARGGTIASRAPICMTVTDSYTYTPLGVKVPAWLFTNQCGYAESFYAEYPNTTYWVASAKFAPHASFKQIANGQPASLFHVLECPSGWAAVGGNPYVCYK